MPVSSNKALIYKDGFRFPKDYHLLVDMFGAENLFELTQEEMYQMNANVFSISPKVVVSEQHFTRLNDFMENYWNLTVERVPYSEIAKMGGLLRLFYFPVNQVERLITIAMKSPITNTLLMVEPVAFGFNPETAVNNYFQQQDKMSSSEIQRLALAEFSLW